MDTLFHYYTIFYLAQQAGFSEPDATVVAHSSQYLDNALVTYEVDTRGSTYETLVTHHFGFWDRSRQWSVWIPFHFFPAGPEGNPAEKHVDDQRTEGPVAPRRVDGRINVLNVVANSNRVRALLIDALKSRDLYRVGIALHTYADSWAHQNFSGQNDDWNRVDPTSPLPPIGHAQKLHDPDRLDTIWEDPRIEGRARIVDSRRRHLEAARRIYRYLATYNRRPFADEELVLSRLESLLGPPGRKRTDERVADFIIECHMDEYRRSAWREEAFTGEGANLDPGIGDVESTVDKILWLKDELLHRTDILKRRPVEAKAGFTSSNLYRWDQAARAQLSSARIILSDLLPAQEIDI